MPRYETIPEEAITFSEKEIKMMFERFDEEHQLYIPIRIGYYTGMRIGEILALNWENVNIEEKLIKVNANLYDKNGEIIITQTTKGKKPRTIIINSKLKNLLKKWKKKQTLLEKLQKDNYKKTNMVCTSYNGTPLTSNEIRYFNIWCKETFGKGSFHTLRHTHATMLLEKGLEIDYVSKRLGHSTVTITSKTYSHITQARNKIAMNILEKIN